MEHLNRSATGAVARAELGARALFLFAAFISFVLSISLWFAGQHQEGMFVGLWVPSILSLGGLVLNRRTR